MATIWHPWLSNWCLLGGLDAVLTLVNPEYGARTFRSNNLRDLLANVPHASRSCCHVFLGLHLRAAGDNGAGAGDVRCLVGVAADIDTRKHGVADEAALDALAHPPWGPPSLVVHSGGGLHAIWVYRQELDGGEPHDRELHHRASRLVRAWLNHVLVSDCCDSTDAVTHSIRLPGTVNWKPERRGLNGSFPLVRVVKASGPQIDVGEILEWSWLLPSEGRPGSEAPGPTGQVLDAQRAWSSPPPLFSIPSALATVLRAAGIEVRAVKGRSAEIVTLKPRSCPACGSDTGSCWISPRTGWLKSFRQRCPAGGPSGTDRQGRPAGIPLDIWVRKYAPLAVAALPDGPVWVDPLYKGLMALAGRPG